MSVDVLGYLNSKSIHLRHAGGNEYHTACFFHGEDAGKRGRLYINCDPTAEIPGLFECKVCGERGALRKIQRHFGDIEEHEEPDESEHLLEIFRVAAAYYHEQLTEEAFAYLRSEKRGLEAATIINHQLGYADVEIEQDLGTDTVKTVKARHLYRHLRGLYFEAKDIKASGLVYEADGKLYDSLSGMITIPYRVAGNVVQIRGRAWPFEDGDKRPKYKTCGGNNVRLFNSDATWETDQICVTEGEFDAMVVEQLGFRAVGVPGARIWQDAWDNYVKAMRRLWIVFDRDATGEQGAAKLQDRFGAKARRIHLSPEGIKTDPTEWVAQGNGSAEFKELIDKAQQGGLLITVDECIAEHEAYQGQPGVKFGIDLLDMAFDPGMLPGQLCVVLAKTGTGKTIFLLNLMQRMSMVPGQEDLKFLFLSLEQTRGDWWERARRIHRFYNLESNDAECASFWRHRIMLTDKNRLSGDEIKVAIDDFDYQMGSPPDVICLDYLGYWARSFKGDHYTRTSEAVMALKEVTKDERIRVVAPHQVSRVAKDGEEFGSDAARDSGVIEETADFLLTIWSPDNNLGRTEEEKSGQIKMRVGKSRHGQRGLLIEMQWAPLSLVMVPRGEPQAQFAREELMYAGPTYRDSWEDAVWRHRTGIKGAAQRPGHSYSQTAADEDF